MKVRARISSKGQVTIPKTIRDALGMREGTFVDFEQVNGAAVVKPAGNGLLSHFGTVKRPDGLPGGDWRAERESAREYVARRAVERAEQRD